jgi:polyisoprenoid-binding protein YceI
MATNCLDDRGATPPGLGSSPSRVRPVAGVGTWGISEASRVAFQIRGGTRRVRGSFGSFGGQLTDWFGSEPSVSGWVEAASIDTGNAERDEELRSMDFFDVGKRPRIRISSEEVRRDGEALAVSGALTIKGVTRDATFTGRLLAGSESEPETIRMTLGTVIDRYAYGVRAPAAIEMFGLLIGRQVRIELQILAKLLEQPGPRAQRMTGAPLQGGGVARR